MGFLDKAKKLAEQAQTKLDEVQKQVNTGGSGGTTGSSGPVVQYDKHGRPIPQQPQEAATPPHGDPLLGGHSAPPAPAGPVLDPSAPPSGAPAPSFGDPLGAPAAGGSWSAAAPPAPPASVAPPATPGVPATEPPSGPPAPVEASTPPPAPPGVPSTPASSAAPAPPMPQAPSTGQDDPNAPSYAPPKMTGGDPLAG